ncbi:hypothetical protein ACFQX4_23420 [Roseomonas sp. GCM10028921]
MMARDGRLFRIERDRVGEQAALARLGGIDFARVGEMAHVYLVGRRGDDFLLEYDHDGTDWLQVVTHELPALRAEGWTVEIALKMPSRGPTALHPSAPVPLLPSSTLAEGSDVAKHTMQGRDACRGLDQTPGDHPRSSNPAQARSGMSDVGVCRESLLAERHVFRECLPLVRRL